MFAPTVLFKYAAELPGFEFGNEAQIYFLFSRTWCIGGLVLLSYFSTLCIVCKTKCGMTNTMQYYFQVLCPLSHWGRMNHIHIIHIIPKLHLHFLSACENCNNKKKKNVERPFIFLNSHTSSGFEGWECKLWAGACWRALAYFDVEQKRGEERKEKEITEESWERKMCCKDREEGSETERERRWGIKKRRGETGSRYIVQLNILSLALPTSVCWINRTVCDNILQGLTAALSHHLLPLPCYNQPQLVHTPTAS